MFFSPQLHVGCEVLMALDASLILASAGQAPREVSGCGIVTGWVVILYP